eukprot:5897412-Pleurochrysis_carterae.AAC.1
MKNVIPDLLHVGDLNVDKQVHKQAILRHLDGHTRQLVQAFYTGMGARINLVAKDGATLDKWFKGAFRAGMILGNAQFPGGVAAWLPTLVYLIGECKIEKRDKVTKATGASGSGHQLEGAQPPPLDLPSAPHGSRSPRLSLAALMNKKYGS